MNRNFLKEEGHEFYQKCAPLGVTLPQAYAEDFFGKVVMVEGRQVIDLTRLDYLSFGGNPEIEEIFASALRRYNRGIPASQMIFKSCQNVELETELVEFHNLRGEKAGRSIVFTSGYATNENIMQALGQRMNEAYFLPYRRKLQMGNETAKIPTVFFVDKESHYSLKDGIGIARLKNPKKCFSFEYRSGDYAHLEELLQKYQQSHDDAVLMIVSDALSSTTGRVFDVERLGKIALKYGAWLYVDEAHSVGVLGPEGRGVCVAAENFHEIKENLIVMGTLTKSFCALGGYIAMHNKEVCAQLQTGSGQYIFSAPIPPWQAKIATDILRLSVGSTGNAERIKLQATSAFLRNSLMMREFNILNSQSYIVPVLVGNSEKAHLMQKHLLEKGFLAAVFKDHAVPKGMEMLRFSLCSDVTIEEMSRLVNELGKARDKFHAF